MSNFTIQVSYGSDKLHVELPGPEATVSDLKLILNETTEIPPDSQKVIFKGKTLQDGTRAVGDLGMKQGSKLLLLGRKYSPELEPSMQLLSSISKAVDAIEKKMAEIRDELEGIEKGFLQADLIPEACRGLDKRCAVCSETLMQNMEKLDGVDIPASETLARARRRSAVVRIQALLSRNDELAKRINDCRTPS